MTRMTAQEPVTKQTSRNAKRRHWPRLTPVENEALDTWCFLDDWATALGMSLASVSADLYARSLKAYQGNPDLAAWSEQAHEASEHFYAVSAALPMPLTPRISRAAVRDCVHNMAMGFAKMGELGQVYRLRRDVLRESRMDVFDSVLLIVLDRWLDLHVGGTPTHTWLKALVERRRCQLRISVSVLAHSAGRRITQRVVVSKPSPKGPLASASPRKVIMC